MKKKRKTKQMGFCLLSAMSLCNINATLYASQQRFLINGEEIQKQYHETARLSFQVEEEEKDKVALYVREEAMELQRIEEISWHKQDTYWIGSVDVMDGDDIQYELWVNDTSYQTPAFSKDTIGCSMKIFEDGIETGLLRDGYTKPTLIQLQFYDRHMDYVDAQIYKDGELISPDWIKENESLELMLVHGQYDLSIVMVDQFGNTEHYEKHILVDDILPVVSVTVNGEEQIDQIYEEDQLVNIMIEEEHLDIARSVVLLDGERLKNTWEMDGNRHHSTCQVSSEGTHELLFQIYDTAGNWIEKRVNIDIDTQAPVVSLMEQEEIIKEWKEIYDHPLHLQMRIEEAHLDLKNSYVIVDGTRQSLDQIKDIYEFVFEDGRHEFQYHIVDQLGHAVEGSSGMFLVDGTAPIIDMEASAFYHENLKLPIKVTEKNLNDLQVSIVHDNLKSEGIVFWTRQESEYTGSLDLEEEGVYEIEVSAVDKADNRTTKNVSLVIDKTAPIVHTGFQDQQTDTYIDHARTFVLSAKDTNLNTEQSNLRIYRNGKLEKTVSLKQGKTGWGSEVMTNMDGNYELKWQIVDLAGNQSNGSVSYVIDQSAPLLDLKQLCASITNTLPSFYYKVMDTNLKEFELLITKDHQRVSQMYHHNKEDVITLSAMGYGNFQVVLKAIDLAGHVVVSDPLQLIYDPDLPILQTWINGTNAKETIPFVTNKDVSLSALLQDAHLNQAHYTLYQDGKQIFDTYDPAMKLDVRKQDGESHTYELIVEASDLAGNLLKKMFAFVIDCEKPQLIFDGNIRQGQVFQTSWTPSLSNQQKEYQILNYALKRNGQRIPYEWKQPIQEEGNYELHLQLRDQAMNRWQMDPFQFSIDHSAPNIRLYDVSNTWYIEDKIPQNARLCIYLDQNDEAKRVKESFVRLLINGREISMDEIKRDSQGFAYYLIDVTEPLLIYVEAIDEAGNLQVLEKKIHPVKKEEVEDEIKSNQKDTKPKEILLSEKEEFGDEIMWLIAGGLLIGCGFLWYGIRKRRNHHS